MTAELTWLIKLLLAHLLTDFILQPKAWVEDRNQKHFTSFKLYLHGLITGAVALLAVGIDYWPIALIIWFTHTLIDGWKSYMPQTSRWFLVDQFLHLLIMAGCWSYLFISWKDVTAFYAGLNNQPNTWKLITAFIFLTTPAGILIGQLTRQWREKLPEAETLANAGKWIGIIERLIILILVLNAQYSAMGLLVAAKSIIRFSEKDRQEIKTEYLVIGTLMSICIALLTGLLVK